MKPNFLKTRNQILKKSSSQYTQKYYLKIYKQNTFNTMESEVLLRNKIRIIMKY